jgi:hypothetical protein
MAMSLRRLVLLVLVLGAGLWAAKVTLSVLRWKAYLWLPDYVGARLAGKDPIPAGSHLVFVLCDHYEPGRGAEGAARNEAWLRAFRDVADRHRDHRGRSFRYTWFYPYDHRNDRVRDALAGEVRAGRGEVELHWHHPPADNASFPAMLDSALAWFGEADLLRTASPDSAVRFAFIHGDWCLDGSLPLCGVTREIDILASRGGYADFTFSTAGSAAQPRLVNRIYYVVDDDAPKSYDRGTDVAVGGTSEDFLIFQGPTHLSWLGELEYGAVEAFALPDRGRIDRWIDAHLHVRGRPEWVFVKVFSHGIQSGAVLHGGHLDRLLSDLEDAARDRGLVLHYMTAREAYNVVKAAEAGREGDPDLYRDFLVPPPLARP